MCNLLPIECHVLYWKEKIIQSLKYLCHFGYIQIHCGATLTIAFTLIRLVEDATLTIAFTPIRLVEDVQTEPTDVLTSSWHGTHARTKLKQSKINCYISIWRFKSFKYKCLDRLEYSKRVENTCRWIASNKRCVMSCNSTVLVCVIYPT